MAQGQANARKAAAGKPAPPKPGAIRRMMASPRWRDLLPRLASAMVLAPIALGAIDAGGLVWQALLTLLAVIAMLEWAHLCGLRVDNQLSLAAAISFGAAQTAFMASGQAGAPAAILALCGVGLALTNRLLGAGVLYLGAGYIGLLLLRQGPGGLQNLLFVMIVVWANDVGGYAAGRLLGGRRMAPKLSPGKTWSGAGGSLLLSIVAGLLVAIWCGAGQPGQYRAEAVAALVSVAAQAGDLLESALKRRTGAKDSSQLIPGHGGLLDRVDGLVAAGAVAMIWLLIWQTVWRGNTLWQ